MRLPLSLLRGASFCLALVSALLLHDAAMAVSGPHLKEIAVASQHAEHAHHHNMEAATAGEDDLQHPAGCDIVRVVALPRPDVETEDDARSLAVEPLAGAMSDGVVTVIDGGGDWIVRDPHACRSLWQVYRN